VPYLLAHCGELDFFGALTMISYEYMTEHDIAVMGD
jgi:hypothetical protein